MRDPDPNRLRALILYVSQRCLDHERLGSVKLRKLLFFCDFGAYKHLGDTITGYPYLRAREGPVPADMNDVEDEMFARGEIEYKSITFPGLDNPEKRIMPRATPPDIFTDAEKGWVEKVCAHFKRFDGKAISILSHQFVGWKKMPNWSRIPLESVNASSTELSEGEKRLALRVADRLR